MRITIKTISGKVYILEDVEPKLTVEELKVLVEKHTEIEPECQRLIFKGKVLKNQQTLDDAKLSDGDCIIVVKSRKKKKRPSPEEKKEARNVPLASANANAGPSRAQANAQPNANPFGFMMGQGQSAMPFDLNALGALFQGNAQANPFGQAQAAAANAQRPAAAANNSNNAAAAANPFAALPLAAMMGQMGQGANNQMPDLNSMMQMLQNPMIQQMLRSPAMQQMLQEVMRNPAMLQNMMRNNPMLNGVLQGMGNNPFPAQAAPPPPAAADVPQQAAVAQNEAAAAQPDANNPEAANANVVPNAVPAANANAQAAGPNEQPVAGPNDQPVAANPQAAQPNPMALLLGQLNNQQPNNVNAPNPLLAFLNAQQMRQQPPVRPPQGVNDAQARNMYAAELDQLQNMGFLDEARNLRALRETAGSVEAAINMLLR